MKWMASLVFIAASTLALAADKFDFDVANVQILIDKAVQKEVRITEAQRTKEASGRRVSKIRHEHLCNL